MPDESKPRTRDERRRSPRASPGPREGAAEPCTAPMPPISRQRQSVGCDVPAAGRTPKLRAPDRQGHSAMTPTPVYHEWPPPPSDDAASRSRRRLASSEMRGERGSARPRRRCDGHPRQAANLVVAHGSCATDCTRKAGCGTSDNLNSPRMSFELPTGSERPNGRTRIGPVGRLSASRRWLVVLIAYPKIPPGLRGYTRASRQLTRSTPTPRTGLRTPAPFGWDVRGDQQPDSRPDGGPGGRGRPERLRGGRARPLVRNHHVGGSVGGWHRLAGWYIPSGSASGPTGPNRGSSSTAGAATRVRCTITAGRSSTTATNLLILDLRNHRAEPRPAPTTQGVREASDVRERSVELGWKRRRLRTRFALLGVSYGRLGGPRSTRPD
jgi:hypothetical protein